MPEGNRLDAILDDALAGRLPANVALMRLHMEANGPGQVDDALARRGATEDAADRLAALRALHAAHPGAGSTVAAVASRVRQEAADAGVAEWAAMFDDLARTAPEAAVALYGLGSAATLAAATAEVVARMREWGLAEPGHALLDIGCGIGRMSVALAPHVASVLGIDVSPGMVAEARRRGAGIANLRLEESGGRDLAGIPDGSVDVALACDVFPYLVAAEPELPGRLVTEVARVLRPGGALLVLNYSYRGDPARDRRDVADLFAAAGLAPERDGTRDLALWDATAWIGRKPLRP